MVGPARAVDPRCTGGKEISPDTNGHCCFPAQVWADGRCVGIPSQCPPMTRLNAAGATCDLMDCMAGQKRVDGVNCCWPGQGWSRTRSVCVGLPRCPGGTEPEGGERCVPVDKDGDGIPNRLDKCPDDPEDKNGFEDADGCPDEPRRIAAVAAAAERKEREAAVNAVHPLETLGGARYFGGLGLVLGGDLPPPPAVVERPVAVPPAAPLSRLDVQYGADVSWVHWTGPTAPNIPSALYDASAVGVSFWLRPEFRAIGRFVTPWFDVRPTFAFGVGSPQVGGGNYSISQMGASGHVGIDVQPWSFFGVGPFGGVRGDGFNIKQENSIGVTGSGVWGVDFGGDVGLHARLRTLDRPRKPELFYLDAELFLRQGSAMSGIYQRDEVGFRPVKGFTLFFAADMRLGTTGTPQPSDFTSTADVFAKTAPMQSSLGGGVGGAF
jgi:hypothetical protein